MPGHNNNNKSYDIFGAIKWINHYKGAFYNIICIHEILICVSFI